MNVTFFRALAVLWISVSLSECRRRSTTRYENDRGDDRDGRIESVIGPYAGYQDSASSFASPTNGVWDASPHSYNDRNLVAGALLSPQFQNGIANGHQYRNTEEKRNIWNSSPDHYNDETYNERLANNGVLISRKLRTDNDIHADYDGAEDNVVLLDETLDKDLRLQNDQSSNVPITRKRDVSRFIVQPHMDAVDKEMPFLNTDDEASLEDDQNQSSFEDVESEDQYRHAADEESLVKDQENKPESANKQSVPPTTEVQSDDQSDEVDEEAQALKQKMIDEEKANMRKQKRMEQKMRLRNKRFAHKKARHLTGHLDREFDLSKYEYGISPKDMRFVDETWVEMQSLYPEFYGKMSLDDFRTHDYIGGRWSATAVNKNGGGVKWIHTGQDMKENPSTTIEAGGVAQFDKNMYDPYTGRRLRSGGGQYGGSYSGGSRRNRRRLRRGNYQLGGGGYAYNEAGGFGGYGQGRQAGSHYF